MGPTASGKTDLAIALADHFPIEIINVDSAQIYLGMDIGSGKAPLALLDKVPHHLMSFLDPAIPYSAAQFRTDALKMIADIIQRKKLPVLVGGSMLYFKALQEGLSSLPSASQEVRANLEKEALELGWAHLHARLKEIDPTAANRISPNDPQRISRALEINQLTGEPMSAWIQKNDKPKSDYAFVNIGLIPELTPRAILHDRIEKRFDAMLELGLITEVERLFGRSDLHRNLPSMRTVGYRQVWEYLLKETTFETMREKAIAATRQLAKRQLTWLRSWPNLETVDFYENPLPETIKKLIGFPISSYPKN